MKDGTPERCDKGFAVLEDDGDHFPAGDAGCGQLRRYAGGSPDQIAIR
ncbi:MAG: hypothetical protein IPO29_14395 [Anaerolineae bacterium]|nr:hypothetical protein [Anaerolineae bacterium]